MYPSRGDDMAGAVLGSRFKVEKRIGRGRMAELFLGKDLLLHELAAVKPLREGNTNARRLRGRGAAAGETCGIRASYDRARLRISPAGRVPGGRGPRMQGMWPRHVVGVGGQPRAATRSSSAAATAWCSAKRWRRAPRRPRHFHQCPGAGPCGRGRVAARRAGRRARARAPRPAPTGHHDAPATRRCRHATDVVYRVFARCHRAPASPAPARVPVAPADRAADRPPGLALPLGMNVDTDADCDPLDRLYRAGAVRAGRRRVLLPDPSRRRCATALVRTDHLASPSGRGG